ncbi:hypothetical protein FRC02_003684, partial [Tulasnella sp. 418]
SDSSRCHYLIGNAGETLHKANDLLSRTGTSMPKNRAYFGAVLFTLNGRLVRIRDEYLTDGEPSDLRWSKNNIIRYCEYTYSRVCLGDQLRRHFSSDKSGGS